MSVAATIIDPLFEKTKWDELKEIKIDVSTEFGNLVTRYAFSISPKICGKIQGVVLSKDEEIDIGDGFAIGRMAIVHVEKNGKFAYFYVFAGSPLQSPRKWQIMGRTIEIFSENEFLPPRKPEESEVLWLEKYH